MLEHAARKRQDTCEPPEFTARPTLTPGTLCGPLLDLCIHI